MHKKVSFRKILVVKPSSLGDVVHSLPFLNAINACFPHAEGHWVIAKGLEGLLEGHPMISRLIVINKDLWKKLPRAGATIKEITILFKRLRDEKYDLVVETSPGSLKERPYCASHARTGQGRFHGGP